MVTPEPANANQGPATRRQVLVGVLAMSLLSSWSSGVAAEEAARRFTAADDIAFARFEDIEGRDRPVAFSPDGKYFAVLTERGRLDINRPESTVRIYAAADVSAWLHGAKGVEPFWTFSTSEFRNGPALSHLQWLGDSSGLAYLAKTASGQDRLYLADLATLRVSALSLENQSVKSFDVIDSQRYVYSVLVAADSTAGGLDTRVVASEVGNRNIGELLFPESLYPDAVPGRTLCELWYASRGSPARVMDPASGEPLRLQGVTPVAPALALSPDGQFAVTTLGVENVPKSWEDLYPPPYAPNAYSIRAGKQDLNALRIWTHLVRRYVRVHLSSGAIRTLVDAPIADAAGWWHLEAAAWSPDGKRIALSNVFMPRDTPPESRDSSRPCIAVVDVASLRAECAERLKGPAKEGFEARYHFSERVTFTADATLAVRYEDWKTGWQGEGRTKLLQRNAAGAWRAQELREGAGGIRAHVRQTLTEPPLLMVSAGRRTKVLWDPNPQLKGVSLGVARTLRWQDSSGRDWIGGLYLPANESKPARVPLVIQNHGFPQNRFVPSGLFTTLNAARALATAGIAVLQVEDCVAGGVLEAPCQIQGYESAVALLDREGLIDRSRLGIMGFSRTSYYVLAALTRSDLPFRAAMVADGVNGGYLQSMLLPNIERDAAGINGGRPFGPGLKEWMARSPVFALDKTTTPLRIEAGEGPLSLLFMWEPYALLKYMGKPVELIYYTERGTHPLTNPAQRLASQGGSVDWFRFWLQDYEDPDSGKAEQYRRWRVLRDSPTVMK